jgi:hypothetical protein
MKRFSAYVEWTANTLSVLAAIVILGVVAKQQFTRSARADAIPAGSQLNVPGVQWAGRPTLFMGLAVTCRYCAASSPFYRELAASAQGRGVRLIGVFPQSETEIQAYLASHDLKLIDARQGDFGRLGITATPTLVLTDGQGRVVRSWVGALSSAQEAEVFTALKLPRSPNARESKADAVTQQESEPGDDAGAKEVLAGTDEDGLPPIVDIRERSPFEQGHVDGAINIPLSELETRAEHELPRSRTVFVYCRYSSSCESGAAQDGLLTHCALAKYLLKRAGFSRVLAIRGDLAQLSADGLRIAGSTAEAQ